MALIQAIRQGSIRGIKLVIDSHNVASCQNEAATTALIEACKFGDKKTSIDMVRLLLHNNSRINDVDHYGRNAFHWACSRGQKEIIEIFLKSEEKLDFNKRDLNGNSVLFHAVSSGDCNFINFFCGVYSQNGGGVETENRQGISAVDLALKLGHKSCAALVNRITGLNHRLNAAAGNVNCCTAKFSVNHKNETRDIFKSKHRGRSFPEAEAKSLCKKLGQPYFRHQQLGERKYKSLSTENLGLMSSRSLPKLTFGNITMSNRLRSQTLPERIQEIGRENGNELTRNNDVMNGELMSSKNYSIELPSPNTYKDLLVDFNVICSVENTPSYRKGFTKPKEKEKTKIVTFSESVDGDSNRIDKKEDCKPDDKPVKNKVARKLSKMSDLKSNSTLISKKERRKSRKSRDEG